MRKEMESARILRQIETAVGAAKIGLDIIDSGYNIRYIDPAWKKVYGDPDGKKCYRYFMGRRSVCPHCGVTEALRTRKVIVKEEVLAREGNKPIRVTTVPFKDGGEWLVAETNVDVTGMKRADQALRDSEKKYRQLFEDNNDAILIADPVTRRLIDCNKKAVALTGYSRPEILSMRAGRLHPAWAKRPAMEAFKKMAAGRIERVETEILTKGGKAVPVSVSATLFEIEGKQRMIGIFSDIHARKKAEDALRLSEQKMALHVNRTPVGVIEWDAHFKVRSWNPASSKIFGYSRSEALGRHASFIIPHVAKRHVAAVWHDLLRRKGGMRSTNMNIRKDGRMIMCDWWNTPLADPRGKIIGAASLVLDITKRMKMEEVLKRDRDTLDKLARQKTKELLAAQEEINKSKRLSEIGLLAATVAHELRTPLGAIRTAAFNIKKKSGDPALESHVANIEKKVLESDQIIRNLLTYAGIKVPTYGKLSICTLVDECIAMCEEVYRGYGVQVEKKYPDESHCIIEADPVQMKEVLSNILSNAYESLEGGKGKIDISVSVQGRKYLRIVIADNGKGINPADLAKIEEPFFTTKSKGTGLGLTVCRQIIDLHGGLMKVASKIGRGTTVTIHIPIQQSAIRKGSLHRFIRK